MIITDIHAHLFNLRYLPVAGIIRRYSNNKVGPLIARGLQWFFWRFTASSFELEEDAGKNDFAKENLVKEIDIDELKQFSKEELAVKLSELVLPEDFFGTELGEALDEFEQIEPSGIPPGYKFSEKKWAPPSEAEYMLGKNRFIDLLNWLVDKLYDGADHIRWFAMMMNGEEYLFRQLNKDNNGVSNYLHLMMDVDYFFDDDITQAEHRCYYHFYPTQVRRMQKLQQNHVGKLKGFVAFNPMRENCMSIIKDSLELGFSGVKFYPPMGYKATGGKTPLVTNRIVELIQFCADKNIALFTHCNNNGFQAFPADNSGFCSNPKYWEEVLQKHNSLRLCLGHGGGGEGWFTENKTTDHVHPADILASDICDPSTEQLHWNNSYAAMVFKLCVEYPNVYCDFSYLDDMINRDGTLNDKKRSNFRTRLLKLLHSEPAFANKIIYGSDWHMLYREKKHGVYYKLYEEFFRDAEFDRYRDGFFKDNGEKYCDV